MHGCPGSLLRPPPLGHSAVIDDTHIIVTKTVAFCPLIDLLVQYMRLFSQLAPPLWLQLVAGFTRLLAAC